MVFGVRSWIQQGHVHAKGQPSQAGWQLFRNLLLKMPVAGKRHAAFLSFFFQCRAVGHFPFDVSAQDPCPFLSQLPAGFVAGLCPSSDFFQERPIGQGAIPIHILTRILGREQLHRLAEDVPQMDVDRSGGAMEVDVGVEVHPGVQEHLGGTEVLSCE